jgi:hypothetical protein
MLSFLGSAASPALSAALVSFTPEAIGMYGLVALVIGLIAWSKYNEPAPSDPYAKAHRGGDIPDTLTHAELGPAVAAPVAGRPSPAREHPDVVEASLRDS